jgi:hypothetical protein
MRHRKRLRQVNAMNSNRIEYCVMPQPCGGWRVLREGLPIAVRRHVFDAVSVATHFAERESAFGQAVKVFYRDM